jgi:predicted membrane channel-forming protein YqfA (hemolysin III family)
MNKKILVTYILRVLGILFVLVAFFGGHIICNLFPGLEGKSLNPVFYAGIFFYLAGAVLYYFFNRRQHQSRNHGESRK